MRDRVPRPGPELLIILAIAREEAEIDECALDLAHGRACLRGEHPMLAIEALLEDVLEREPWRLQVMTVADSSSLPPHANTGQPFSLSAYRVTLSA